MTSPSPQSPRPAEADDPSPPAAASEAPPLDFEALFGRSPNAYMVLDRDLRFVAANASYLRSVGGADWDDLAGRHLFDVFPSNPDDPGDPGVREVRASLERARDRNQVDHLALVPYTIPLHTPEGVVLEERYWSATHTPLPGPDGRVAFILQHTVDVTELQQMRQALEQAEAAQIGAVPAAQVGQGVLRRARMVQETNQSLDAERRHLLSLFEQAPGFVAVLSGPQHVFTLVNAAYDQIVGYRAIVGRPVGEALPEVARQGFVDLLDEVYASGEPYVGRHIRIFLHRTPDAPPDEVYLDFVYQPIVEADGTVTGIFVQGHEVTETVRVQNTLRRLNTTLEERVEARTAQVRALAARLTMAEQEERRRISQILHDDLQQLLYGLEMQLSVVRKRLHAEQRRRLVGGLDQARRLVDRAVTTARQLTVDLSPPILLHEGLLDMLEWLQRQMRELHGLGITLEARHRWYIADEDLRVLLFQIVRELLFNVKKHAGVEEATVRLADEDGRLVIYVLDHGCGFDTDRVAARERQRGSGFGLFSARERLRLLDGRLEICSRPGRGTRVAVHTPLGPATAPVDA